MERDRGEEERRREERRRTEEYASVKSRQGEIEGELRKARAEAEEYRMKN